MLSSFKANKPEIKINNSEIFEIYSEFIIAWIFNESAAASHGFKRW